MLVDALQDSELTVSSHELDGPSRTLSGHGTDDSPAVHEVTHPEVDAVGGSSPTHRQGDDPSQCPSRHSQNGTED